MVNLFIMDQLFNMPVNWVFSTIRWLFALIDSVVYRLIEVFFRIIFNLANFELVGLYEVFEQRVYVILGIFMLFKVTVSLITYLVNPDKISDKEQGVGKVVTRIITVLVMLIALPTFFNLATELQNKLLPVIPRVIIGTANQLSNENVTGVASNMSLTMLQGFAHRKDECSGAVEDIFSNETTGETSVISDFVLHINDTCEANGKKIYAYDYLPIISTIVGILMIYVLFSLAITVAIRTFKLIILRMISPIPVISYVDPKSSKDGMFATWTKTFVSTWGELFLLLGIIYFIVFIIDYLLSGDFWKSFFSNEVLSNPVDAVLIFAFLIIGLLFFAKQAPKFLFDALGIKTKGNFVRMLGMGAAALGGVGSARATYQARNDYDAENGRGSHKLKNFGASLFGGLGAAAAGGSAVLSADKPNLLTGFNAQAKNNATALSRINAGSTLGGRLGAMGQTLLSGQSDYDRMTREIQGYEDANKALLAYKGDLEKKALEQIGDGQKGIRVSVKDAFGNTHTGLNYSEFMTHTQGAQNGNAESLKWFADHGWTKQVQTGTQRVWDDASHSYVEQAVYETVADWQGAQAIIEDLKTAQINEHANRVINGYNGMSGEEYDGTSYNTYRLAQNASSGIPGLDVDFASLGSVKKNLGVTNREMTDRKIDPKYRAAKANAEATKK